MKRRVAGVALGSLLAAGVVAGAVLTPGYASLEPHLDGSSVWIANADAGVIGLANTANSSIERIVSAGSADLALQAASGTIIIDRDASTARVVLEGAAQPGPAVPIAPEAEVGVRGDRIVVTSPSTGDVWRTTTGALAEGAPLGDAVVALGSGGVAVLTDDGLLAASPGLGRVLRVDAAGEIVSSDRAPVSPSAPELQLTVLGDDWVLYDSGSGVLSTRTWQTVLDASGVRLQEPGAASQTVVYAADGTLVRQRLGVPSSTVLASGAGGEAANPIVTEECVFAVWHGGTAWRSCEGAEPVVLSLEEVAVDADLRIVQRGSATAVVDPGTGDAWAIDRDGSRITGWELADEEPTPEDPAEGETVEETVEADPAPPVAEDDELGARPGAVALLPVLLNDSDANGDPIVITEAQVDRDDASVSLTPDGRSIRLEAPESGEARVSYRVSDGTMSDQAVATVTIRSGDEPPELVRPLQATLEAGGSIVLDALDGWVDPEGDPLAVLSAAAEEPDRVSVRADGRLEFRDGRAGAQREVRVTVTDGEHEVTETIALTVHAGTVPITAQPVTAVTRVGHELVLEPLLAARGGSGELSLHNVVAGAAPVTPDFSDGTIRVSPTEPGLLRFGYVVSDGESTRNGLVAVRVLEGTDASSAPVTRPARATVPAISATEVEVGSLAHDPAGGVVAITEASSDSESVRAEVIDGERVRLSLADDLEGDASVTYTVTNGLTSATGELRVSQSATAAVQAPIARDDVVSVRPGGLVEIPVLANDEQPDGLPIALEPEPVAAPEEGLLFVDGDRMRYVAAQEPGTFTATYAVRGPDGQTASADITLRVVDAATGTNAAPIAPTIEARVVAGASVDLPLPLSHADPNGDPVQLLGPSAAPALGFVTQSGRSSTLRYQAGDYSEGTDEFRYRIKDDLGAVAEGLVRITVVPPGPALPPVLEADEAQMRPDSTLVVPVLDNDSDPAGLPLEIVGIEVVTTGATVEQRDGAVLVTAGPDASAIGVLVTVENSAGSSATSWLRIEVDPDAPPPAPDVEDVQVAIQSIADAEAVVIEPLAHASVRDGRSDVLEAALPLETTGVQLRDDGAIEIAVTDRTRFVPFTITRSDDPSATGTAVIAVPGRLDALPQLRAGVAPLRVQAGETIEIAIDDVVDTVDGSGVLLTDASAVEVSPDSGVNPVIDLKTLRFAPPPTYYGPASISFEVTDGDSATDPEGRIGTIVLPIEVVPGDDQPLGVLGAYVRLEAGDEREIDLTRITRSPDPARLQAATWAILEGVPPGFRASVTGSTLTVAALEGTAAGTTEDVEIGVWDSAGEGQSGAVRLQVITSTRPLAAPVADAVTVQRGRSAQVTPLANDEASNPFPTVPLRIGAISEEGAAERGISASLDGGTVTIDVDGAAQIGTTIVRVLVVDATDAPSRAVWSPITVTVQDVPDAPAPPVQAFDEHVDGVVTMRIEPPAANGSPITGYRILGGETTYECGAEPRCRIEGLPPGVELRLRAVAVNALGASAPSAASEPVHADRRPAVVRGITAAPTGEPGSMRITWQPVPQPQGGTPIEGYLVRITGNGADRILRAGATERSTVVTDLTPGLAYSVAVAARNAAGVPDEGWRWPSAPVPFTAVGEPATTPVLITGQTTGTVTASWSRVDAGGASSVAYAARIVPVGEAASLGCDSSGTGVPAGSTATSATLSVAEGSRAVVAVIADNGWHCSVSLSDPVFGKPAPVDAAQVRVSAGAAQVRDDALDLQLTQVPSLPSGMWFEARVRQAPQATEPVWTRVGANSWLTPTTTSFAYGREASVDLRACAPSGAGAAKVCSDPTSVGSGMPLSLEATVNACTPLAPLNATPPANAGATIRGEVVASYLIGSTWSSERAASEPVPAGATQVRAWGVVTYLESRPHRDEQPTVAGCGL
ncbi:Fibronectin type III domain-containing protein [Agrococcus baldri]|uniref:Fibronectin type III domain-containing protein n=1 Tax=Agrococcus baldri TaxID=153730 RepID=A0AA94KYE4_9MICO|nr:Ig-like domain-containing protein [Agrococcus baldri]SFR98056.1 Fibronectin type III domain-containing protein [Agrococcus baldri]